MIHSEMDQLHREIEQKEDANLAALQLAKDENEVNVKGLRASFKAMYSLRYLEGYGFSFLTGYAGQGHHESQDPHRILANIKRVNLNVLEHLRSDFMETSVQENSGLDDPTGEATIVDDKWKLVMVEPDSKGQCS